MTVQLEPVFAGKTDARQLRAIFRDAGMDLSGPIQHHVVLKDGATVIGGAKLVQVKPDFFFLEVIGVREDFRQQGYGSALLGHLLGDPWRYCRLVSKDAGIPDSFAIGTLARGKAQNFYRSHGFVPVSFTDLPEPYNEQCTSCPDRDSCRPSAMIFTGTRSGNHGK